MTTEPATLAAAEFTEDRIAGTLMQAARLLVDVQGHVQPEALAAIRAGFERAAGVDVTVRVSSVESCVRVVLIDAQGEELQLLRRIDLTPVARQ